MVVLLLAGIVLFALAYLQWRRSQDLPPGPYGLPVVGYLPWLAGRHPHLKFTALARQYGPVYSLWLGNVFTVVVSSPRLVRQAFAMEEYTGRAPLFLTHGIMKGNGIICVQGEKWKETRRFVTAALRNLGMVKFGPGRTKMEQGIMCGVRNVVDRFRNADQPCDPEPVLIHALGNVLFKLVFGKEWSEDDETWRILQNLQEEGTKMIGVSAAINFLPFLRFLPQYRSSRSFIEEGISFTHIIYQSLLRDYEADVQNNGTERPAHVMAAYVEEMRRRGENGHFNRIQFNYLMADIFGAGVDTTLATLRWFLLFLALNPEWQGRIQAELYEVTEDREVLLEHVERAPSLEAAVWETQRLRAVTPVGIPHGTLKETYLEGYKIPAGAMIVPLQWAVHMDPSAYDDPEQFNPGRFFAEDGSLSKPDHFIPFQTGKRMCVGEEYARALLFLFGGNLLKEFRVSVDSPSLLDMNGEPGITLTPPHHRLFFVPRARE